MSQTQPIAPSTGLGAGRPTSSLAGLCAIALPIGHLSDLAPRARQMLEAADLIAAEDTRVFQEFVARNSLELKKSVRIFSHHDHNERESTPELIRLMKSGLALALVSDAGTPNISDPGHHVLQACFENQIPVTAVPGPCSITMLLSVCPMGGNSFSFHGFFPSHAGEAQKLLNQLRGLSARAVFFSSPHRFLQDLEIILDTYGDVALFIGRELTKPYEEFLSLTAQHALTHFQSHAPRGEFVLAIAVPEQKSNSLSREDLIEQIKIKLRAGMTARDLRAHFTDISQLSRQSLYDLIEEIKKQV